MQHSFLDFVYVSGVPLKLSAEDLQKITECVFLPHSCKLIPYEKDNDMIIKESAENYLEAILKLTEKNGDVRSIDIAEELNISKPSVSVAMKNFRENGYIETVANGHITLTEKGMEIATRTYSRHRLLKSFLMKVGVNEATADFDACKIEHDISDETYERLEELYKKL